MNQEDSLITDTAYTESREIEHYTVSGIAINTFKFKEYPPKDTEMYLEYTDVDGEKNGAYQTKKIRIQDLGKEGKVTLLKEEKKEEEKEDDRCQGPGNLQGRRIGKNARHGFCRRKSH